MLNTRVIYVRLPCLSQLSIDDAVIDIHRAADNALRVAGITVWPAQDKRGGSMDWGFALAQLKVRSLRIHYRQAANGDRPIIERDLVFNNSSARDVVSWQKDNKVPVDTSLRIGDSHIRASGRITPFGDRITARIELATENLDLDLLSPISRSGGLKRLTGTLDSRQQIDFVYAQRTGLSITIDGEASWRDARMTLSGDPAFASERFDWQGTLDMHMPPDGQGDPWVTSAGLRLVDARGAALKPRAATQSAALQAIQTFDRPLRLSDGGFLTASNERKKRTSAHAETRPQSGPNTRSGRFNMDGRIRFDGFQASRLYGFEFSQNKGEWQGSARHRWR